MLQSGEAHIPHFWESTPENAWQNPTNRRPGLPSGRYHPSIGVYNFISADSNLLFYTSGGANGGSQSFSSPNGGNSANIVAINEPAELNQCTGDCETSPSYAASAGTALPVTAPALNDAGQGSANRRSPRQAQLAGAGISRAQPTLPGQDMGLTEFVARGAALGTGVGAVLGAIGGAVGGTIVAGTCTAASYGACAAAAPAIIGGSTAGGAKGGGVVGGFLGGLLAITIYTMNDLAKVYHRNDSRTMGEIELYHLINKSSGDIDKIGIHDLAAEQRYLQSYLDAENVRYQPIQRFESRAQALVEETFQLSAYFVWHLRLPRLNKGFH